MNHFNQLITAVRLVTPPFGACDECMAFTLNLPRAAACAAPPANTFCTLMSEVSITGTKGSRTNCTGSIGSPNLGTIFVQSYK